MLYDSDDEMERGSTAENDLETGSIAPSRRESSGFSRNSSERSLLHRHDSRKSNISAYSRNDRTCQKIYIENEDLVIVIAGFTTSRIGFAAYVTLCFGSLGVCYLLFRWLPRLLVWLIGCPTILRDSTWVVIEVRLMRYPNIPAINH